MLLSFPSWYRVDDCGICMDHLLLRSLLLRSCLGLLGEDDLESESEEEEELELRRDEEEEELEDEYCLRLLLCRSRSRSLPRLSRLSLLDLYRPNFFFIPDGSTVNR